MPSYDGAADPAALLLEHQPGVKPGVIQDGIEAPHDKFFHSQTNEAVVGLREALAGLDGEDHHPALPGS